MTTPLLPWAFGERSLAWTERPLIMGILNVTPDSFSDGGRWQNPEAAVAHGEQMLRDGADIIDVGGESTRPDSAEVPAAEETARIVPVIRALRHRTRAPISVDTMKASVARAALEAGADIINDVSAFTADPGMVRVAADSRAGVILMHMQGTPRTMQKNPTYTDVVKEVRDYLAARVEACVRAGIDRAAIAVDPGIGFGKTVDHNLRLIAAAGEWAAAGRPVVMGLSRKSFLGKITGRDVNDRLAAGIAALTYCVLHRVAVLRVHDVKESLDAVRVAVELRARNGRS